MRYFDYEWDIEPGYIKFDPEINIDKLGWKAGDCFKITNINGRAMLIKLDPVEQFVKGHKVNSNE
jgi:hypothetical protein